MYHLRSKQNIKTLLVTCVVGQTPSEAGKEIQQDILRGAPFYQGKLHLSQFCFDLDQVGYQVCRNDAAGNGWAESEHPQSSFCKYQLKGLCSGIEKRSPQQNWLKSGTASQACHSKMGMFPWHPTDWGDPSYPKMVATTQPFNFSNHALLALACTSSLPQEVMISGGCWDKAEFMYGSTLFSSQTLKLEETCPKFENYNGFTLEQEQNGGQQDKVNKTEDSKIKLFEIAWYQYFPGLTSGIFSSTLVYPEVPWHQHTIPTQERHESKHQLGRLTPNSKIQPQEQSLVWSQYISNEVCSDLLNSIKISKEIHPNYCIRTNHKTMNKSNLTGRTYSKQTCAQNQRDTKSNSLKTQILALSQDGSGFSETFSSEIRNVEKPYNHGTKTRRRLVCVDFSWSSCSGGAGSLNKINSGAQAKQSDYAQLYSSLQKRANSGCDMDFYGLTNDHNVFTDGSCTYDTTVRSFWTVNLGASLSINAILFIENESDYIASNNDPYAHSWLLSYTITLGASSTGLSNTVCVALGTITKGGWFPCGGTGQYLSINSTTKRIVFSEIMAYTQYAIQMNALSPPVCAFCTAANPAIRALLQEVTLTSASASLVETGLTDTNPTIIFYLKAATQIKAVVLLGAREIISQPYQTNTDISVKNFNDGEQQCTHLSNYNTYTESDCSNFSGNTVIVQRQDIGLIIAGFGILSDCDCTRSSFDPTCFTAPFTDNFASGTSLSTIAGGVAVSVIIHFNIPDTVSSVCGNADGFNFCGTSRQITLTDLTSNVVMTTYPYKKVSNLCIDTICTLTLENTVGADNGSWQIEVKISLTSNPIVFRTQVVTVSVYIQGPSLCISPIGSMNLLNTAVSAQQSAFSAGQNTSPNIGCNGISESTANSEFVFTPADAQPINYWSVMFAQTVAINTLLLIGPEGSNLSNLPKTTASIGSSTNFQTNPICLIEGQLTDGGWYQCSGSGNYLALWSTTNSVTFYEIMAYVSFAIQWNSISQTWQNVQADPNYPAANVLSKIVVINDLDATRQKCIASSAGTASSGSLSLGFKAQHTIKAVVLVPGRNAAWTNNQQGVTVKVTDVTQTVATCGIISDYNIYSEQVCSKSGNFVTLTRSAANVQLSFCSVGILSDCDCAQTSFDQAQIYPFPNFDTILSISFVNVKLGATKSYTIFINSQISDTVSSVCGNADGRSFCGDRVITFTDSTTGQVITEWPYKDFSYLSGTLILNPTKAQTTVIKVTVSLVQNQKVSKTEVLTSIVSQGNIAQIIATQYVYATVGTTGGLVMPQTNVPSTFVILSKQGFTTDVTGNFLTVLSVKATDQGKTYTVNMSLVPNDPNVPASFFNVQVKFAAKIVSTAFASSTVKVSQKNSQKGGSANKGKDQPQKATVRSKPKSSKPTKTSQPKSSSATSSLASSQTAQTLSSSDQSVTGNPSVESVSVSILASDLMLKYDCALNDQNKMECIDKQTANICIFNDENRKLDCSVAKKTAVKFTVPTVTISQVNNMGLFFVKFSERMNMAGLLNTTTPLPNSRSLRSSVKNSIIKVINASQELENSYKYLFNSSYIDVQTVSGGSVNSSMLNYTWQTTNITDSVITIQVRFMFPRYVSSDGAFQDSLHITLNQTKLNEYVSQQGQSLAELPDTQNRVLPVQIDLEQSSADLQQSASTLESVGQATVTGYVVMNVVLSQAMSMMWSFVNALQIILCMPLINIPMPCVVYLVLQNLSSLASFDVFPTQDILDFMFQFTETDSAGVGFISMGTTSKRIILYLGSTFLFMILVAVQVVAWLFCYIIRKAHLFFERAQKKLQKFLFWRAILRLAVQGCLDFSIGIMLSLEQLQWTTCSDIFDSVFTIISLPIMAALPLFIYLFLKKIFKILQLSSFKRKFGPLFEGFLVDTDVQKQRTTPYMSWFIVRRQLLALVLVPLRNQTVWIQLAGNTWLTLADLCLKIHLSPYSNYMGGTMEKINDTFVLVAGYFIYLFTDYTLTLENKAIYGWFFNGVVGFMIALNLSVMLTLAFQDLVKKFKRSMIIRQNKKIMALKGFADLEKKKEKTIDQVVAEALGIHDLMNDPVGISEERKEEILYERGEENVEQVIARQQEEILIAVKVAKYKTRPENQNFFGHNKYVQLLEDFKFNEPEYWNDDDLQELSDRARQNRELEHANNFSESSKSGEELGTISEESSDKSQFPSFREGGEQIIEKKKFDQPQPIALETKIEEILKNHKLDSGKRMSLVSVEEMEPEIPKMYKRGIEGQIEGALVRQQEQSTRLQKLHEKRQKTQRKQNIEEKKSPVRLTENNKFEEIDFNQPDPFGREKELQLLLTFRPENVQRMSLESVEGVDPELLKQETERFNRIEGRRREILNGMMPHTIQGKGVPDRVYDPKRSRFF